MPNLNETEHEVAFTVLDAKPNDFLTGKFNKHVTDVSLSWCDVPAIGLRDFNVWGSDIILVPGKSYRATVARGISQRGKEYKTIKAAMPLEVLPPDRPEHAASRAAASSVTPVAVTRPHAPYVEPDQRDTRIARMNAVKCIAMSGGFGGLDWRGRAEELVDYTLNGLHPD